MDQEISLQEFRHEVRKLNLIQRRPYAMSFKTVYTVYAHAPDGSHLLGEFPTLEAAREECKSYCGHLHNQYPEGSERYIADDGFVSEIIKMRRSI